MPEHEIEITVIVQGQPVKTEDNVKAKLLIVVEKALKKSGNGGQPPENWELRDTAGQILDLNKTIADYGILNGARLFLSLKAGVGG